MPQIKPDLNTFANIKVVGIGGYGGNAVTRMIQSRVKGVEFIAINTDSQDLHNTLAHHKLNIGKNTTRGLGAGMNPELGRKSAEEDRQAVEELLSGADMVVLVAGLGGGTGSGALPVIAQIARQLGCLAIAVVTLPFEFEGPRRSQIALEAWQKIKDEVDSIITIPNDRIFNIIDKNTSILDAFNMVDSVLRQGVQGIADLLLKPGLINVDFADVKMIMENSGTALLGIGEASGANRAVEAAKAAIHSPLLEISIDGARGILFNVSGSPEMTLVEINEAAKLITQNIDRREARVIFGATFDESLRRGTIRVIVIATNFSGQLPTVSQLATKARPSYEPATSGGKSAELKEDSAGETFEIPAFLRKKLGRK